MENSLPVEPQTDIDQQKVKSARDLLLQLVKTVKTVRLYLANNPMRQKFIAELFDRFDLHLRTHGMLRLKVRQGTFLVDGQVVYENQNRQEGLAFRCYVDGISELAFHEGFEQRELVEFLELLASEREQTAIDDDLVSLIWQRDLPHISYVVVDDLPASDEVPDLSPPKEVQLQELISKEVMHAPQAAMAGPKRLEFPLAVFQLTEDEIAQLKAQIAKEEQRDPVTQLLDIMTVMLEIEEDEVSFAEVVELIEKLVDLFVDRGDLAHAAAAVRAVRALCDRPPSAIEGFRPKLHEFLIRMGGQERLQLIATAINEQETVDTDALLAYLSALTPEAIVPLTGLLGSASSLKARKVVCEVLVELGKNDVDLLASRLRGGQWFVIRNLIYVLGRIGGPKVVQHLAPLSRHPEQRVRKEVVKTLDGMARDEVIEVLLGILNDQESAVRLAALRALARRKSPQVVAPLAALITDRNFVAKDLNEKLEIFVTLASSGQAEAIVLLKKYVRRTSWWKRAGQEQLRWCAAYALKQMGTAEAMAILEEGSQGRNRRLREACVAVLRGTARELMMKQVRS